MNIKNILSSLYILMLLTVAVACKKDDEKPTDKELITKSWMITSATRNDIEDPTDYSGSFMTFSSNGTYTISLPEGNMTGNWEMSSDGSKLTLDKGLATEQTVNILELTKSSAKVELIKKNYKSGDITVMYRMVPK